jgi:hypothetical protein
MSLTSTEINSYLNNEYERAKKTVQALNNKRFTTEKEALKAFENSGISRDLFYRITRQGANNTIGYKIQLLTKDMFSNYKDIIIEEQSYYSSAIKTSDNIITWNRLDSEVQMTLINKGWTQDMYNSKSIEEKEHVIKCISF